MKKCPDCAEEIRDDAIDCRYCGSMLPGAGDPVSSGSRAADGVPLESARLLNTDGKIAAIKYVREKKGLGLAEAKAYVLLISAFVAGGAFVYWWMTSSLQRLP